MVTATLIACSMFEFFITGFSRTRTGEKQHQLLLQYTQTNLVQTTAIKYNKCRNTCDFMTAFFILDNCVANGFVGEEVEIEGGESR